MPAHQLLAGRRHIAVQPGASPGSDRAAQRRRLAHLRHPYRQAGDVAEDLAPQRPFRAAAGENQAVKLAETIAAFSSSARKRVALLHFSGSMERLINDGAAWYHCLKCMASEKIGITPWEPAGTRLAISSSRL